MDERKRISIIQRISFNNFLTHSKHKMKKILSVLLLISMAFSSFAQEKINEIILERTPCFGKCATYKIRLFRDGRVYFTGIKNTNRLGVYSSRIPPKNLSAIFRKINQIEWADMQDRYKTKARDLSHLNLTVYGNAQLYKKILEAENGPVELQNIGKQLDAAIKNLKWKKIKFEIPPTAVREPEDNQLLGASELRGAPDDSELLKTVSSPAENQEEIVNFPEVMPEFPGGTDALMSFLTQNIRYPEQARELGIQGKVICKFVVEPNGEVTNISVLRGVHPSCDQEAVRVLKKMPAWKPGMQKGRNVRVSYTLPIVFKLN